jgi:NADH-quinone oxidoreductase subunit G
MSVATIHIDDRPYTMKDGENLLQECLSLGFDLPYFCWHPALGSVGACRQCAIKQFKDSEDTKGKIVMACMTPAKDGTRISIDDPQAREFRAEVIEWLMTNHPHDCPVCDEGGECHLQDMTLMTGHTYRRYDGRKRTWRNQDLGPLVDHEMNRCIQCYRCVRFYRHYAGGKDFDALSLRNQVYFGRDQDGTLESEFSGNLVEVCPTGVFTDKTLGRHYTRKWDLQTAPSVCVHCGSGCNTIPGERYGTLRRILNRYNGEVNGYFLCDRGRYGYEFVNSERRIRQAMLQNSGSEAPRPVSKQEALSTLAGLLADGAKVIGIGSPRASIEANFALRSLVGRERFHLGMSGRDARLIATILDILRDGPARTPSLHEVELADAVLVLGEDLTNTAPRLALALRQSVRQRPLRIAAKMHIPHWDDNALRHAVEREKGPLFLATLTGTKLDDVATETFHGAPDDLARLGFAVAHALDARAPQPDLPDTMRALADTIAQALKTAQRPLVISGMSCGSDAVIRAAANVAWALCGSGHPAELCYAVPECNSMGAAFMEGKPLEAAFQAVQEGNADTVVILENDLYRRADTASVNAFLTTAKHVVVIDHVMHATGAKADVVLPAGSFAEADGTLVSNEGRAQRFFQVFVPEPEGVIQESWRWVRDILAAVGREQEGPWRNLDQLMAACTAAIPALAPIVRAAPLSDFRIDGQKIPRETHRYSGRTAIRANLNVHELQPPPNDPDAPMTFSMEGYPGQPPPPLIPIFWAPRWNSAQAVTKFQDEVGGPLRGGDPGVRLIEPARPEEDVGWAGTAHADASGTSTAWAQHPVPTLPGSREGMYFGDMPAAFEQRTDQSLLVPLHHIFGSEELSVLAPGIAALAASPYLALHPDDAAQLGYGAGDDAQLHLDRTTYWLPVQLRPDLPRGVAGLPAALPSLEGIMLPAWGEIARKASS